MKEEAIIQTLNKFAVHFGIEEQIENLQEREKILKPLQESIPEDHKILHDFIMLYESLNFVKTDKMLMLKARDLWKMETDRMTVELHRAVKEIERLGQDQGIDMKDFMTVFEK